MSIPIRSADRSDLRFLEQMLFEAAFWRPGQTRPAIVSALAEPELAKLLADWGRDGDTGVVAEMGAEPVGAAWYRFWSDDDHSYGYVDASIPEVAIGVVERHRGRGVGTALLEALVESARFEKIPALSLSVERDNPALRLYERIGFEIVGSGGNAWTMLLALESR